MNITKPIAFFDLEGTGLDIATDRIVSISPALSDSLYIPYMGDRITINNNEPDNGWIKWAILGVIIVILLFEITR